MAGFTMSLHTARNKDIKHMLSSEFPKSVKFREYDGMQELDIQRRYHEQQIKPPERFEVKFMESFKNIALPKAPAYWRPRSKRHLRKIITRVSTPTHNIPSRKIDEEDRALCPKDHLKKQERVQSAVSQKQSRVMSAKELSISSKRLTTQNMIGRLRLQLRSGQTTRYNSVMEVQRIYGDFTNF